MNWNDPPPEIERLRTKLYDTRQVVLSLMTLEVQEILKPYILKDLHQWERFVLPRIIALAQPIGQTERAFCPLCGDGPEQGYRDGFKLLFSPRLTAIPGPKGQSYMTARLTRAGRAVLDSLLEAEDDDED